MYNINFLEQLAYEYYQILGYFVIKNRKIAIRAAGGWDGELDVVAIDVMRKKVVHVECGAGRKSRAETKSRLEKKFALAKQHIHQLVPWDERQFELEQVALVDSRKRRSAFRVDGAKTMTSKGFVEDCIDVVRAYIERGTVVPETYPILRTIYFVHLYTNGTTYF